MIGDLVLVLSIVDNKSLNSDYALLVASKVLLLCQAFEQSCKSIVMYLALAYKLHKAEFKFLSEEHKDFVSQLESLFLGNIINELDKIKSEFSIKNEDIEVLKIAKESRNYFCHELLIELVHGNGADFFFMEFEKQIRKGNPKISCSRILARYLDERSLNMEPYKYEFNEELFLQHLQCLAEGDYLVSKWTYNFHEKEAWLRSRNSYVEEVKAWVLN